MTTFRGEGGITHLGLFLEAFVITSLKVLILFQRREGGIRTLSTVTRTTV